ncbi:MAG: tRNA lysidine(34) synthetase TilS [Alphaproteobacteria bacterium]|nr:tRNA lysidine(34) synthetase TilS [Alphaproteobacteria bacterium]MBQ8686869.1 tRNA lysidine(34) synthetase TilS [Alphaproteobacteria bacterium]
MNEKFLDFIRQFSGQHLAVAVSGGVDSVCLLHWLVDAGMNVTALHVNHHLRPAADMEAQYVADLCKSLNIPFCIFDWLSDKPLSGLEAAARTARYQFMTDFCRENNIDALVVAHQADDQIETFLMNLARGSGIVGLSAIRDISYRDGVKIIRPLLNVYRHELVEYCDKNGIKYFHDEMNDDENYTRVKIRKNRHLLASKLGISDDRILLAIQNLSRARDALDGDIASRVNSVLYKEYALFSDSFLFDVPPHVGLKSLGMLIQIIGGDEYQPRLNSLNFALSKLHSDCKFTLGHCTIRRFKNQILIVPEGAKTSIRKKNEKIKRLKKLQEKK